MGTGENSFPVPIFDLELAEPTGLEPATSDVTGRRSNQLNYDSAGKADVKADVRCQRLDVGISQH
jgi:hypothetical protein